MFSLACERNSSKVAHQSPFLVLISWWNFNRSYLWKWERWQKLRNHKRESRLIFNNTLFLSLSHSLLFLSFSFLSHSHYLLSCSLLLSPSPCLPISFLYINHESFDCARPFFFSIVHWHKKRERSFQLAILFFLISYAVIIKLKS